MCSDLWIFDIISHIQKKELNIFFYKCVETSRIRLILKMLNGSLRGKVQRGQYSLAVGLSDYSWVVKSIQVARVTNLTKPKFRVGSSGQVIIYIYFFIIYKYLEAIFRVSYLN